MILDGLGDVVIGRCFEILIWDLMKMKGVLSY